MTEPKLVLVVDDHPIMLDYNQARLRLAGFFVLIATNGQDALRLARNGHPHVIVSDIRMPEMDGYALCRALAKEPETASIPVILYSAHDVTKELRERALSSGASAVLTATPDPDPLVRQIEDLLKEPT